MGIDWVDVHDRIEALHMEISAEEERLLRQFKGGEGPDQADYRTLVGLESLLLAALALSDAHATLRAFRN